MSDSMDTPRSLWRIAVPAYGPTVLSATGVGAILPVLALSARDLGASIGTAALVVGLIGVGALIAALPAGTLVARIGERRALVLAGLAEALAMLGAFASAAVWQLGLSALLLGAVAAVFGLARQAYLTDAVAIHLRARALSTLGGVHRIGMFVGPLIGAGAIAVGGLRAAYLVGALAALAAAVLVVLTRDITRGREQASAALAQHRPAGTFAVIREHRHTLLTLGTGVLMVSAARACRTSLVPLWAEAIGLDGAQTSLVFAIAAAVDMLLFYPAGAVMDRYGRVWTAVPTVVLLGLGMILLPLTGSIGQLTAVAMVMALGNGIGSGIVMTLGADASPADARPQFLAGWRLVADTGSMGGPLLVSGITAVGSLALACVVMGGLTLAGGAWLTRWVPRFDPRHGR